MIPFPLEEKKKTAPSGLSFLLLLFPPINPSRKTRTKQEQQRQPSPKESTLYTLTQVYCDTQLYYYYSFFLYVFFFLPLQSTNAFPAKSYDKFPPRRIFISIYRKNNPRENVYYQTNEVKKKLNIHRFTNSFFGLKGFFLFFIDILPKMVTPNRTTLKWVFKSASKRGSCWIWTCGRYPQGSQSKCKLT